MSVDPDVGPEDRRLDWRVVAAVAVGGVAGAEARYALGRLDHHSPQQFPWMTLAINVVGCLLIGVLMTLLGRAARPPRLARPLLGTGVLGGFTTFSTFSVDVVQLLDNHCWGRAAGYLIATVVGCIAGVVAGRLLAGTGSA